MIELIEDSKDYGYKIYRSNVIIEHQEEMLHRINSEHGVLMNRYGQISKDSTWLYRTYNIFSLVGACERFHELYTDLLDIIKLYLPNEPNPLWFQSWLNFQEQNQVLNWHSHNFFVHGYISIDPKNTETVFRNYSIKNELGNIYIGPGNREHKVEVLEPFKGKRITLGFDVGNIKHEPNELISLIPIVK